MKVIAERLFAALLFIGALLHAYGSFATYEPGSSPLVWSLGSSVLAVLIAVLAVLRSARRTDIPLSLIVVIFSLAWVVIVAAFGQSVGNIADPRVLWHVIAGLALAGFALSDLLGRRA